MDVIITLTHCHKSADDLYVAICNESVAKNSTDESLVEFFGIDYIKSEREWVIWEYYYINKLRRIEDSLFMKGEE